MSSSIVCPWTKATSSNVWSIIDHFFMLSLRHILETCLDKSKWDTKLPENCTTVYLREHIINMCNRQPKMDWTLAMEVWSIISLAGNTLVCVMEWYGLDVGLTSTHSKGSGTKLFDQGWSLYYFTVPIVGSKGNSRGRKMLTVACAYAAKSTSQLKPSWRRWCRCLSGCLLLMDILVGFQSQGHW